MKFFFLELNDGSILEYDYLRLGKNLKKQREFGDFCERMISRNSNSILLYSSRLDKHWGDVKQGWEEDWDV